MKKNIGLILLLPVMCYACPEGQVSASNGGAVFCLKIKKEVEEKSSVMEVHLFTNKKRPIVAYKNSFTPEPGYEWTNYTYNAHGATFANQEYWINNSEVPKILEDEYVELKNADLKNGDVIIYYQSGEAVHSLTYLKTPAYTGAYGKSGYSGYSQPQNIEQNWGPNTIIKYYRATK